MRGVADRLPLATLLSQSLVALTIELDNEFELRVPHRTQTRGAGGPALRTTAGERMPRVWLTSWVMWANYMQYIDGGGVRVGPHDGVMKALQRWGYVVIARDASDERSNPPRRDWLARPTDAGRFAQGVWRELGAIVEERWRGRFGDGALGELRGALGALVGRFDVELPDYLPVLGYGLRIDVERLREIHHSGRGVGERPLTALLAQALLALTVRFERRCEVALPISANVLRLAGDDGVRLAELPRLAGVSKEAIAMAAGVLETRGYAAIGHDRMDGKSRLLALSAEGRAVRDAYPGLLADVEARFGERFGAERIRDLRGALEQLTSSPHWGVPEAPDGVWRAALPRPAGLPHHPMVLHRGGYPDGS
jgi:DNA-binding MarR family transcriptional regulator